MHDSKKIGENGKFTNEYMMENTTMICPRCGNVMLSEEDKWACDYCDNEVPM